MSNLSTLTLQNLEKIAIDAYQRNDFDAGRAAEINARSAYRALARQFSGRHWRAHCRAKRDYFSMSIILDGGESIAFARLYPKF